MPIIPSLILTNQNPVVSYTASVVTSGSNVIADSLGNQLTSLQLTASYSQTSSFALVSLYSTNSIYDFSSSFASQSLSSSYISASGVVGGLTTIEYIVSGSPWTTMSFINGILVATY